MINVRIVWIVLPKLARTRARPRSRLILFASFGAFLVGSYLLFKRTHYLMTWGIASFNASHSIINSRSIQSWSTATSTFTNLLILAQRTGRISTICEPNWAALVGLHANTEHVTNHGRHFGLLFFHKPLFESEGISELLYSFHILVLPLAHRYKLSLNHIIHLAEVAAQILERSGCCLFSRGVYCRRNHVLLDLWSFLSNCCFQITQQTL